MIAARVKRFLALLLHTGGWFALQSRVMLQDKAVILMYHRVLPQELVQEADGPVQAGMYVTPDSLRMQLAYLKANFSVLSLGELVDRLQAGEDIAGCAVLTFDDGWLDNYLYAFPLLQEFNMPATIFLATGFIGTSRWFWPEEIGWTVLSVCEKKVDLARIPESLAQLMKKEKYLEQAVDVLIDRIIGEMKSWDEPQRLSVVKQCRGLRQRGNGTTDRLLMNWDEIKEMGRSRLVQFASHTVSHALLDQLSQDNVQQELVESVEDILKKTGTLTEYFAYPNGNYTQQTLSTLVPSGITAAVTTKRGFVHCRSPVLELPRIAVHEDVSYTQALFQWRLFIR